MKGITKPKTMKPFYTAVGGVLAGRHIYKKIRKKPTDLDITKDIIERFKEKKEKKEKKKKKKDEDKE